MQSMVVQKLHKKVVEEAYKRKQHEFEDFQKSDIKCGFYHGLETSALSQRQAELCFMYYTVVCSVSLN